MKTLKKISTLLLLALAFGLLANVAQAKEGDYALLIVGDTSSAEMLRQEKVLIDQIAAQIRQNRSKTLPVYSYHFDKANEKAYCERRLNVLAEDLLFVGVVRLNAASSPVKVVYRIERINNPARSAKDILDRAYELKLEKVETVQVAPQNPSTPPPSTSPATTTPNTSSAGPGYRVQLGVFAQREYAARKIAEAKSNELTVLLSEINGDDGDTLYKVWSPLMVEKSNAESLVQKFRDAGFEEAFVTRVE